MKTICVVLVSLAAAYAAKIETVFKFEQVEEIRVKDDSDGVHWAVIVAGSNGWYNYRHQADACHAYQILHRNGIPEERIVVMMYDDIANNEQNPTPGIIINRPNGTDVYHGVPKDYTGEDVTPSTFLSVLQGDQEGVRGKGSGKVINSGPNDHIFVNFVDHGAPGILAFPDEMLHATKLNRVIKSMAAANKFAKMVFYVEACESGSMFDNLLPKDINVFATTAANPDESSYACYYDRQRDTYLGDVYSVKWMEDSDQENLKVETLSKQFRIVKEETNTSHVMEYGDLTIGDDDVAEYQGNMKSGVYIAPEPIVYEPVMLNAVPSEDVPLMILRNRLANSESKEERIKLTDEILELEAMRQRVRDTVKHVVGLSTTHHTQATRVLGMRHPLRSYDCYEPVVEEFSRTCFHLPQNDYALRHMYKLVNLCEEKIAIQTIVEAIQKVCLVM